MLSTPELLTSPISSSPAADEVLIIDLENCPNQIRELQHNLGQYSIVVICYAQSHARIPLDWLIPLTEVINQKRLRIYRMTESGKNSADFGIAFFSGMLAKECPANTSFTIVSNDTDMDHVVHLLQSQERQAQRIGNGKRVLVNEISVSQEFIRYCQFLAKFNTGRPAKRETLRNSIKSQLKNTEEQADKLLNQLSQRGVISLNNSKVSYHNQHIQAFAQALEELTV